MISTEAVVGIGVVCISGLLGLFINHIRNGKHPNKSSIVYKDVCELEQRANARDHEMICNKIAELKSDTTAQFNEVKELIRNHS